MDVKVSIQILYLSEASPLDYIWGVKLATDNPAVVNMKTWRGYNLLGYALTEAMRKLRKESI